MADWHSKGMDRVWKFSHARYERNRPGAKEMAKRKKRESTTLDSKKMDNKMMGKSVIKGAMETLMPSRAPCVNDWEMTSIKNGPGEKPIDRPSTIPAYKEAIIMQGL